MLKEENRESLLGINHSNKCCRQNLLVSAKIPGWKFEEKQDLHSLKVAPRKHLSGTKEKKISF